MFGEAPRISLTFHRACPGTRSFPSGFAAAWAAWSRFGFRMDAAGSFCRRSWCNGFIRGLPETRFPSPFLARRSKRIQHGACRFFWCSGCRRGRGQSSGLFGAHWGRWLRGSPPKSKPTRFGFRWTLRRGTTSDSEELGDSVPRRAFLGGWLIIGGFWDSRLRGRRS